MILLYLQGYLKNNKYSTCHVLKMAERKSPFYNALLLLSHFSRVRLCATP